MNQAVIIDDEPHIVENLTRAIDWNGFHLEIGCAETDPQKALAYILSHPVSVVITDIAMPKLDGLALIRKIKEAKPYVYVIVLSAYDNFEYARTALRYGAENYLLKPVDPDELSDTISQIAGHIQAREQLNSTYGQAMFTFRNAFTEQWVKNLLTGAEFSTKAKLLGINLDALLYTAVVFSCTRASADMMSRFFELLLRRLPGHYAGNFFFASPVCLVGVLCPVRHPAPDGAETFVRSLLQEAKASGIFVFASVGPSVGHYSSVPESYSRAVPYIWLEHAGFPVFVPKDFPGLSDTVGRALAAYESSFGENVSELRRLYKNYPPFACTAELITARLRLLCHEEYRLPEEFPELCRELSGLSDAARDADSLLRYALGFLSSSDLLLERMQQSMYPCVDAVIKSISDLSNRDVSLKTLAARLNVTPSYLGMVFHRQTGYYFNDYLAKIRLEKAADLLEHTDLKLKEIVEKTGFSSQPYFTRSFKRFFNTSPLNYRREKRSQSM